MTWPRDIGRLTIAGATAFWIANVLISLTPVAADYRSALSTHYVPMLVEAALRGLLITTCLSWLLLTFPDRIPGRTPVCPRMARQAPPADLVSELLGHSSTVITADTYTSLVANRRGEPAKRGHGSRAGAGRQSHVGREAHDEDPQWESHGTTPRPGVA
jgi:hypothetical protein